MKRVVITQQVDHMPERGETRDVLDQRLIALIHAAGFVGLPVPNVSGWSVTTDAWDTQPLANWLGAVRPEAVVLSGGQTIGQSPARDLTEYSLLDFAESQGIPVLAICRGMQVMAHRAGTALKSVTGHAGTRHALVGEIEGEVNSYHNFSLENCPFGFRILARREDGEIEAIAHDSLSWEGWMWHPEREKDFFLSDLERVRALFGA